MTPLKDFLRNSKGFMAIRPERSGRWIITRGQARPQDVYDFIEDNCECDYAVMLPDGEIVDMRAGLLLKFLKQNIRKHT